jgi:hypothetical protein
MGRRAGVTVSAVVPPSGAPTDVTAETDSRIAAPAVVKAALGRSRHRAAAGTGPQPALAAAGTGPQPALGGHLQHAGDEVLGLRVGEVARPAHTRLVRTRTAITRTRTAITRTRTAITRTRTATIRTRTAIAEIRRGVLDTNALFQLLAFVFRLPVPLFRKKCRYSDIRDPYSD